MVEDLEKRWVRILKAKKSWSAPICPKNEKATATVHRCDQESPA
jgi:hypothetical protein